MNVCREHVKLYHNHFGCHLVVGLIVVGFFCCYSGHCNHVGLLIFSFMGVFKVHKGLGLGFQTP
jgi:hypothetical protein